MMERQRLVPQIIGGICALFCLSSCGLQSIAPTPTLTSDWPVYATPMASLKEIPIFVGAMTFNELDNRGFTQQYVVSWTSDDLQVTTDGKATGSFRVIYDGPPVPYTLFKDILFFQVQGRYIWPQYGDILQQPLSDVVPIIAQVSDKSTAEFYVDTSFQIPPLVNDIDGGMPLNSLALTLTWVRVYQSRQGLYVHVFPGDIERYPNKPKIGFDQEPRSLTGRFGYYTVLPESSLKGGRAIGLQGEFEYSTWLQENIKQ